MGTDIHFYVERRENGAWVSCDTWEPDKYAGKEGDATVPFGKHFYEGRSYDTFAMLANVRNGDGFVPISEPRGLPDDLSPQLQVEVSQYLEHTPSWLLLSELMAYDWTQTTIKRGWQTPYYRSAKGFLSETMPRLWRLGKPEDVRCVFWFDS